MCVVENDNNDKETIPFKYNCSRHSCLKKQTSKQGLLRSLPEDVKNKDDAAIEFSISESMRERYSEPLH